MMWTGYALNSGSDASSAPPKVAEKPNMAKTLAKPTICKSLNLLTLACIVVTSFSCSRMCSVKVTVTNECAATIHDVTVAFTGGRKTIGDVDPQQTKSTRIRVSNESGLTLSYRDANGTQHSIEINAYIEPGYSGEIQINVQENGKVSTVNNVKI